MSKTPPLILKEGIALKVLESERLRTFKLVGIECLILVHSRKFVFLTFFAILFAGFRTAEIKM